MNTIVNLLRKQRSENVDSSKRIMLAKQYLDFFPNSIYIKEELALAIWHHDPLKSLLILNTIESSQHCDEQLMRRICYNKFLLLHMISNQENETGFHLDYPIPHTLPLVSFSITTCQRLDLFTKTMYSFLNNFKDLHLIFEWICVDDNSSQHDRDVMKTTFPFMHFIWKPVEQSGHASSMQIIRSYVKTPYLIHIEDDRVLVDPNCYISNMMSILKHDKDLGQVVFNHNYAETLDDDIIGGKLKCTNDGYFYFEHEYLTTDDERTDFHQRHGYGKTIHYYPHFSLSPSMIKTEIFATCQFKSVLKFEYMFALDYTQAGYKTAFLPGFHFKHVGRLTSEIFDPAKFNAYDLNNTDQFTTRTTFKLLLINLDRRVDRMNLVYQQKLPPFERISAVDGNELNNDDVVLRINQLCGHGDYNLRTGVVGCALSHLKCYKRLLSDDDVDGYIILEDDVYIPSDVNKNQKNISLNTKLNRIFRVLEMKGEAIHLVFFTHVPKYNNVTLNQHIVTTKSYEEACDFSIGGTGCYYISKQAARLVFHYVYNNGIDCPIDVILYRLLNHIRGYFVLPPLISQMGSTPSDIQHTQSVKKINNDGNHCFETTFNDLFTVLK